MLKGFKEFLLQGNVVVISIGLIVALAFSNLIEAFSAAIISPLVSRVEGNGPTLGLGIQLGHAGQKATFVDFGSLIAAIVYFAIFMAVLYFAIVLPYKKVSARRGVVVFGPPAPAKTCPECLSSGIPAAATRCMYCTCALPAQPPA